MSKYVKLLFVALAIILVLWIDLPENLTVKLPFTSQKITINPLSVNIPVGTTAIRKDFRTHLGLDLKGGSHLVFEADIKKLKSADITDALSSARDIIERRVNLFGVSEPSVTTVKAGDTYRINVDLPGVEDVSSAIKLIGSTAQLSFKSIANIDQKTATSTPVFELLTKDTGLKGQDIKKATVVFDPQTGKPQVSLTFSKRGTKLFADLTTKNVGKPIGIFIDQQMLSAPVVQQPILDGSAVITGEFTIEEAKQLAIAINSGALPLPLKLIEQRNVGPTLGAAEVAKSTYAGVAGLLMVFLFMIIYYGRMGIIACLALLIYGALSFALFRAVPVVLTLSGIAGFILSIGMAVDSNILIFERIKEERRRGLDFDTAVRLGFGRALDAIKDANFTTLIVAFILFNPLNWEFLPQFGLVRGFALTLAIGVGMSLFTGVFITKHLINLFYKNKQNG